MKPCPFCGSSDIRLDELDGGEFMYWCGNCGAFGPNDIGVDKAREMWNLRRPEAALVGALEFYANEDSWIPPFQRLDWDYTEPLPILDDGGDKARAALAAARPQEAE